MEKNKIDKFLDALAQDKKVKYEKVYYRPTKIKCIINFFCSLVFLILLIICIGFKFELVYFLLYGIDILIILFNGINLFTVKGWYLSKHVAVDEEQDEKYRSQ